MKACVTPLDVLDAEDVKQCIKKEVERCVSEAPEGAHGQYLH